MQVVILAAGRGDRFRQHGQMIPKPMLHVKGKRMLTRALEQAAEVSLSPVVVCMATALPELRYHVPERMVPEFVPIRYVQKGAAMSLLTAACALKDDEPVMVLDCDTVYAPNVLKRFDGYVGRAFTAGFESALLCFTPTDDSARYSFVKLATRSDARQPAIVSTVAEKVRISDTASCGAHAYASWAVARQAIYEMVILDSLVNGEYYLAPSHNNVRKTTAMVIESSEFYHVGTPAELEAYESRS